MAHEQRQEYARTSEDSTRTNEQRERGAYVVSSTPTFFVFVTHCSELPPSDELDKSSPFATKLNTGCSKESISVTPRGEAYARVSSSGVSRSFVGIDRRGIVDIARGHEQKGVICGMEKEGMLTSLTHGYVGYVRVIRLNFTIMCYGLLNG